MALYKEIRQDDGVVTKYHRVLYVMNTVNRQSSIAVISYIDEEARANEKTNTVAQPYQKSVTYETAYDSSMTAEAAYDFLKRLPEFEGAEDI